MNKDTITEAVENRLWKIADLKDWRIASHLRIVSLPRAQGKKPVDCFRSILGRQNYTFQGSQRMWVWERGDWRVYVGNSKGVCVEIRHDTTSEEWDLALRDLEKSLALV